MRGMKYVKYSGEGDDKIYQKISVQPYDNKSKI
jgi:hypothetical protein